MKQALYLIIVLVLCMLIVPGIFDQESSFELLGLDITTWIGGIGIVILSSLAISLSKENIKKVSTKKSTKSKAKNKK